MAEAEAAVCRQHGMIFSEDVVEVEEVALQLLILFLVAEVAAVFPFEKKRLLKSASQPPM